MCCSPECGSAYTVQKILPISGRIPGLFICFVNLMHKACHLPVFIVFSTQENLDE